MLENLNLLGSIWHVSTSHADEEWWFSSEKEKLENTSRSDKQTMKDIKNGRALRVSSFSRKEKWKMQRAEGTQWKKKNVTLLLYASDGLFVP